MALSTAQPSIGGTAPDLPTRIIRFRRPKPKHVDQAVGSRSLAISGFLAKQMKSKELKNFGLMDDNFEPQCVITVTVALVDLCPEFHYKSMPRLSPHSFLQAKAKNTSPYTMLAGPANIFLDNNFIAKSELADVSPNEEFTTSQGVDQSLRITCQPVEAVHNTRYEQVPLSSDDRVKVQVLRSEVGKAQMECPLPCGNTILNDSNNMECHVSVESEAEHELQLVYTMEHPYRIRYKDCLNTVLGTLDVGLPTLI